MKANKTKEVLIRQVNLLWYAVALVPLVALFLASAYGYLPALVGLFAVFLLFFWLFSFGFAVYSKFRKPPKEPRQ
jgi:hypothetical protein